SPARVDAAGDLAAGKLIGGEPCDQFPHLVRMAGAQQGGRGEGAVADPGASIGAGARLDGGAVAVDKDVGDGGLKGFDERVRGGRQTELDTVEALVPVAGDGGKIASIRARRVVEWDAEIYRPFPTGR